MDRLDAASRNPDMNVLVTVFIGEEKQAWTLLTEANCVIGRGEMYA